MITQGIMAGIKSRSKVLSRKWVSLEYEDLVQDGVLFVLILLRKKPDAPFPWVMKAINNYYSKRLRDEVRKVKRTVPLTEYLEETLPDDLNLEVDIAEREEADKLVGVSVLRGAIEIGSKDIDKLIKELEEEDVSESREPQVQGDVDLQSPSY